MNWFKRALLSLWGHKGRSILLILVFGILAMLIYCGLAVHSAAEQEITNAKASVGAEVTLKGKLVVEKYDDGGSSAYNVMLTQKVADKLNGGPYVRSYNRYISSGILFDKIEPVCDKYELEREQAENEKIGSINSPTGTLIGVMNTASADQFTAGGYTLIAGRHITSSDSGKPNVLIEQQLAQKNGLKVGDKITLCQAWVKDQRKLNVTIVGIFHAPMVVTPLSMLKPENFVFTSLTEIYKIDPTKENNFVTATYLLDDPSHIDAFAAWGKKQIDGSKYELATNGNWYKRMTGALGSVSTLANLLMVVVILAACAVMGLIAALSIHSRRREFGVLLSIGEKRRRILLQVFLETLIPVCIAFCIAVAAGGLLAPSVGDMLLSRQTKTTAAQSSADQGSSSLPSDAFAQWAFHSDSFAQPVNKIDIEVSTADLAALAGLSLLIVLVSSAAPCATVLRLSPSRVLNKKE